jgi:hypothetical protein
MPIHRIAPSQAKHPFERRQTDAPDCAGGFSYGSDSRILVMPVMPVMLRGSRAMLLPAAAANRRGSVRRGGVGIGYAGINARHGLAECGSIQAVARGTALRERWAG